MKWLDRIVAAYKVATGRAYSTADPELAQWFGQSTYAGKTVNEETAMQLSTVFICNRIITETFGMVPLLVYEKDKKGNVHEVDHDLGSIFEVSPNVDMVSTEFKEALASNLSLQGNTYSLKSVRGDGQVSSLYPIPSENVTVTRDSSGATIYKVLDRGRNEDYPAEKIWHVKGFGSDGLKGYSPIGYQRQLFGTGLATEEFQARFFSNGAMPSWILSIPQWLKDEQRPQAKQNIQEMMAGTGNAYKVILLEGGITATAATMPLEDAQFLQLRGATRDDIFGIFRVPPHMGGNLERSTNNNIEQQALEFVQYCMMPYFSRVETSARKHLLGRDRTKLFVRFDLDTLLRADAKTRADLHSRYAQNAVLSRNEIRGIEGYNRSDAPGMDDYTLQSNLVPVDMLRAVAEKLAKESPTPLIQQPPNKPEKDPTDDAQ